MSVRRRTARTRGHAKSTASTCAALYEGRERGRASILWSLMIPAAGFAIWPWIKRVRIGLAPPDAELREALDARSLEGARRLESRGTGVSPGGERLRDRLREVEQERDRVRLENEQLKQENKNLQAERDTVTDELVSTKRDKAKLRQELRVA